LEKARKAGEKGLEAGTKEIPLRECGEYRPFNSGFRLEDLGQTKVTTLGGGDEAIKAAQGKIASGREPRRRPVRRGWLPRPGSTSPTTAQSSAGVTAGTKKKPRCLSEGFEGGHDGQRGVAGEMPEPASGKVGIGSVAPDVTCARTRSGANSNISPPEQPT